MRFPFFVVVNSDPYEKCPFCLPGRGESSDEQSEDSRTMKIKRRGRSIQRGRSKMFPIEPGSTRILELK